MTVIPIGMRRAATAATRLAPRHRVALALEGTSEQLSNVLDLMLCGRSGEARLALLDAREELNELRALLGGDRNLVEVHELGIKRETGR